MKLSKTNYLIWRECPHNAWLKMHRPDIYNATPLSDFDLGLMKTGNEIDALARVLFPGGQLVTRGDVTTTAMQIEHRAPVLYQPVFETDHTTTACDILVWDAIRQVYDLYEVKASTNGGDTRAKNELYTYDLAFQAAVLAANGVPLGKLHLVRLDSDYQRAGELDIDALFTCEDFSEAVADVSDIVRNEIDAAYHWLTREDEPAGPCACITRGRSSHCTTFSHSNPNVPDYSVHNIARIGTSKKKLTALIDAGILDIRDVPDDAPLSVIQANQVHAAKSGRPTIEPSVIAKFLTALKYPLAFIDYETYPAAIPRFAGYHPFEQIPFQFSLDVINNLGLEIEHHEFLAIDEACPDAAFIAALRDALPESGAVIVWNKTFETTINRKLASRNPATDKFFQDLNNRVVDLADVFTSQAYVHPKFRGRTSIKAVLTALVPELSYKSLAIQEGGSAGDAWNRMVSGELDTRTAEQTARDLLAYCGLDTRAMVEIWRVLEETVATTCAVKVE